MHNFFPHLNHDYVHIFRPVGNNICSTNNKFIVTQSNNTNLYTVHTRL